MLFSLLSQPLLLIPIVLAIVMAITFHEFSHALVAEKLGDGTAKALGRLTLNPLSHIDPWGFLLLFLVGFGWGKPVPFNPHNLKNPKWGAALIGFAGPISNLLLGLVALGVLFLLRNLGLADPNALFKFFLVILIQFNLILMLFNLIPVPPLDGSKILLAIVPERFVGFRTGLLRYGPMILFGVIFLDIFTNLNILGRLFAFFFNGLNRVIG